MVHLRIARNVSNTQFLRSNIEHEKYAWLCYSMQVKCKARHVTPGLLCEINNFELVTQWI